MDRMEAYRDASRAAVILFILFILSQFAVAVAVAVT